MIVKSASELTELSQRIFEAAGCPAPISARVTHALVDANLVGHDSHGVIRIPNYVGVVRSGNIIADAFAEAGRGEVVYTHSGTLIIGINPRVFVDPAQYAATADETIRDLKAIPPAPGSSGVMIQGEPEARSRADRIESGIPLAESTWDRIVQTATSVGVGI